MVLHEQVAVLEQITDLPLDPLLPPRRTPRLFRTGATLSQLGLLRRELLAHLGDGTEDRLGQLGQDVEFTDLMRHVTEDLDDRGRIERRAIRRDPAQGQPALVQCGAEAAEEVGDVILVGVVIEDAVGEPLEGPVIDDRQDAERPVVEFVGGDIAGEVSQRPLEIVRGDASRRLFPPRPRPSSGSWRRGRRRDDRARGANWRLGRAIRPRRRGGPPGR
jgi:hypothetical protein